jgi:RNA polymerase sigma factor (TIGR02999 family)
MSANESAESSPGNITRYLQDWRDGDAEALSHLTAAIYRELHRLAGAIFAGESGSRTLQPTALVHELYLKLPELQRIEWQSRAQFLNVSARVMRNILVDHARKRRAAKRGGGMRPTDLEPVMDDRSLHVDVLAINDALDRLQADYPRQARVVELRFFGGLTTEEAVEVLQATGESASLRTVERDWKFARAWLLNDIGTE